MQKLFFSSLLVIAVSTGTALTYFDTNSLDINCLDSQPATGINEKTECMLLNDVTLKNPVVFLSHKEVLSQWRDYPLVLVDDINS